MTTDSINERTPRLVVMGGGESGAGAAVLGKTKGYDVFVTDMGKIPEKHRETLVAHEIEFEEGGHTEERVLSADVIVKSPGIPPTAPLVARAAEAGIPILSEIEFAGKDDPYVHRFLSHILMM